MNRIKELRQKKGMKQAELAEILQVAQNTLSYWENNKYEPDNNALVELAKIFHVNIEYLLGNTNDPTPISVKKEHLSKIEQDAREVFDALVKIGVFNLDEDLDSQMGVFIKFVNSNKDFILALKDKSK